MEGLTQCNFCKREFNTSDRVPYILFPCSHSACELCTKKLKEQGNYCTYHQQPQENEIKAYMLNANLLEKLKQNFGIIIHCGKHPKKPADYYHKAKRAFICADCATKENRSDLVGQDQNTFVKQGELLCNYASALEKKIEEIKKIGKGMFLRNTSYSGDDIYLQIFGALKCISSSGINIDKNVFSVYLDYGINFQDQVIGFQPPKPIVDGLMETKQLFSQVSLICKVNENYSNDIIRWLDKKYQFGQLLYRGTSHGFEAQQFHERCDGKGPTLTIVQTIDNYFFGGFTSASWHSQTNQYEQDREAFIFSLTHSTKHPVKKDKVQKSIKCYSNCLPVFGCGYDFYLFDKCNANTNSFSDLGHAFERPAGIEWDEEKQKSYLAGKWYFSVKQVEVFQLKTI